MHFINEGKRVSGEKDGWSFRNGNCQLGVEDARSPWEPMQAELKHMQRPRGF